MGSGWTLICSHIHLIVLSTYVPHVRLEAFSPFSAHINTNKQYWWLSTAFFISASLLHPSHPLSSSTSTLRLLHTLRFLRMNQCYPVVCRKIIMHFSVKISSLVLWTLWLFVMSELSDINGVLIFHFFFHYFTVFYCISIFYFTGKYGSWVLWCMTYSTKAWKVAYVQGYAVHRQLIKWRRVQMNNTVHADILLCWSTRQRLVLVRYTK